MHTDRERLEIRTLDGQVICSLLGRLRDAVNAIQRHLDPVHAVLSAFTNESATNALVTGYCDWQYHQRIVRYLLSSSGDEFENWWTAEQHASGWLPGGHWRIGAQFLPYPPPSGIVAHAVLQVKPSNLPAIDFARESGTRRTHYAGYAVDVASWKIHDFNYWATSFVIRSEDGGLLGPMNTHAIYEIRDHAICATIAQAQLLIDAGTTLAEVSSPA